MKDKRTRSERLTDALGMIDDDILYEAYLKDSPEKLKTPPNGIKKALLLRRIASLAACLVLLIGVVALLPDLSKGGAPMGEPLNGDGAPASSPVAENAPEENMPPQSTPFFPFESDDKSGDKLTPESAAETSEESSNEGPPIATSEDESSIEMSPSDTTHGLSYALPFGSDKEIKSFLELAGSDPEKCAELLGVDLQIILSAQKAILGLDKYIAVKEGYTPDSFAATYEYGSDVFLTVTCIIEGRRYVFTYAQSGSALPNGEPTLKDVTLGSITIDLYSLGGTLFGGFSSSGATVRLYIEVKNPDANILFPFELIQLKDSSR